MFSEVKNARETVTLDNTDLKGWQTIEEMRKTLKLFR
jgi:hypothetical protein